MARPQIPIEAHSETELYKEGIDIVISMDASGSMLAKDFYPNRFEASKDLAKEFIKDRVNDRVGLVIFEGEAYTQCPLTSDREILIELDRICRARYCGARYCYWNGLSYCS